MAARTKLNQGHWASAASTLEEQGQPYVVITLIGARGSTPRENGTKMVVSIDQHSDIQCFGTIGGGHLEYQAIARAGEILSQAEPQQILEHFPLGAKLGQCCGGAVSVLFESFVPHPVKIMVFGAGHVGKALIKVLGELPCHVSWVDARPELFDTDLPSNVTAVSELDPVDAIQKMPPNSYYLVMTHNHGLDFELCSSILKRGDARYLGLIGSETKWQRFQLRFQRRGYDPTLYDTIRCPVGLSQIPGKLPMELAVSIAGELISEYQTQHPPRETRRGLNWQELANAMPVDKEPHTTT